MTDAVPTCRKIHTEAEGWKRPDPVYGPVEPAQGWSSFAARAWDAEGTPEGWP